MSGAHVHDYCGKNFEDLTNILNQLPYADSLDLKYLSLPISLPYFLLLSTHEDRYLKDNFL
jgi:hypothetical protein